MYQRSAAVPAQDGLKRLREFQAKQDARPERIPIEHTCDGSDVRRCECAKERLASKQRTRRAATPEKTRDANLRRNYGISLTEYEAMRVAQGHRCAACGRHEGELSERGGQVNRAWAKLVVDHCHTGGHVRALLCAGCNSGIGLFDEDPERLEAVAAWLRSVRKDPGASSS